LTADNFADPGVERRDERILPIVIRRRRANGPQRGRAYCRKAQPVQGRACTMAGYKLGHKITFNLNI
jgi:hypothetical protein